MTASPHSALRHRTPNRSTRRTERRRRAAPEQAKDDEGSDKHLRRILVAVNDAEKRSSREIAQAPPPTLAAAHPLYNVWRPVSGQTKGRRVAVARMQALSGRDGSEAGGLSTGIGCFESKAPSRSATSILVGEDLRHGYVRRRFVSVAAHPLRTHRLAQTTPFCPSPPTSVAQEQTSSRPEGAQHVVAHVVFASFPPFLPGSWPSYPCSLLRAPSPPILVPARRSLFFTHARRTRSEAPVRQEPPPPPSPPTPAFPFRFEKRLVSKEERRRESSMWSTSRCCQPGRGCKRGRGLLGTGEGWASKCRCQSRAQSERRWAAGNRRRLDGFSGFRARACRRPTAGVEAAVSGTHVFVHRRTRQSRQHASWCSMCKWIEGWTQRDGMAIGTARTRQYHPSRSLPTSAAALARAGTATAAASATATSTFDPGLAVRPPHRVVRSTILVNEGTENEVLHFLRRRLAVLVLEPFFAALLAVGSSFPETRNSPLPPTTQQHSLVQQPHHPALPFRA
uniref:Uncharacterized protein n=1 Tax=Mycena chlorophos TaxID=658473 RepID=A0ABQ0KW19_MYCCL|nr:predicted protein [Mycena chlorophos]